MAPERTISSNQYLALVNQHKEETIIRAADQLMVCFDKRKFHTRLFYEKFFYFWLKKNEMSKNWPKLENSKIQKDYLIKKIWKSFR